MLPRVTAGHIGSDPAATVVVNDAGWDKSSADRDRVIAVNRYGVLHTCQAVLSAPRTRRY